MEHNLLFEKLVFVISDLGNGVTVTEIGMLIGSGDQVAFADACARMSVAQQFVPDPGPRATVAFSPLQRMFATGGAVRDAIEDDLAGNHDGRYQRGATAMWTLADAELERRRAAGALDRFTTIPYPTYEGAAA